MFLGRRAEILETTGSFNNPESFDFTTPHRCSSSPKDELDFKASFPLAWTVLHQTDGPGERLSTFARLLAEQEAWRDCQPPPGTREAL